MGHRREKDKRNELGKMTDGLEDSEIFNSKISLIHLG
jgi:hypothetical protein